MSGQTGSGDSTFEEALLAQGGIAHLAAYPPELLQQAGLLGPGMGSSDALQVGSISHVSPSCETQAAGQAGMLRVRPPRQQGLSPAVQAAALSRMMSPAGSMLAGQLSAPSEPGLAGWHALPQPAFARGPTLTVSPENSLVSPYDSPCSPLTRLPSTLSTACHSQQAAQRGFRYPCPCARGM